MSTIEVEAPEFGAEELAVRAWRLEQFEALGWEGFEATLLAETSIVDLNAARRLIRQGCSLDVAFAILV